MSNTEQNKPINDNLNSTQSVIDFINDGTDSEAIKSYLSDTTTESSDSAQSNITNAEAANILEQLGGSSVIVNEKTDTKGDTAHDSLNSSPAKEERIDLNGSTDHIKTILPPKHKTFVNVDTVTITDNDKDIYFRQMLLGLPTSLTIKASRFNFEFRSKQVFELEFLYKLASTLRSITGITVAEFNHQLLKYNLAMMLLKYNDIPFITSDDVVSENNSFEVNKAILDKRVTILNGLSVGLFNLIVNSGLVFERKEVLLNEFAINEDFSRPLDM